MARLFAAECVGTFWLVLGGCGAAVVAAAFPQLGIGFIGVAFAFGLSVLTMAYAVGHISGAHFNPAVTAGFVAAGRLSIGRAIGYVIAQVLGACAASAVLLFIASGKAGFDVMTTGLGANGYAEHSPGGYLLPAAFVTEVVMTFFFLIVVLGATSGRAPPGFAPLAIGLALTVIHLVSIPVTNTSVNPARSTGPALIVGGWALKQLWLFWVAPLLGALVAGFAHRWFDPVTGAREPAADSFRHHDASADLKRGKP
jgi:aquaporin Z